MSKYYKAEEVDKLINELILPDEYMGVLKVAINDLPTIEVSEDAISREWAVNELEKLADDWVINNAVQHGIYEAHDLIKDAPSVVPSRPKGEWRTNDNTYAGSMQKNWKCTNCCDGLYDFVCTSSQKPKWNFCPNCGADMKGAEE